jgi:hypothetical protein
MIGFETSSPWQGDRPTQGLIVPVATSRRFIMTSHKATPFRRPSRDRWEGASSNASEPRYVALVITSEHVFPTASHLGWQGMCIEVAHPSSSRVLAEVPCKTVQFSKSYRLSRLNRAVAKFRELESGQLA